MTQCVIETITQLLTQPLLIYILKDQPKSTSKSAVFAAKEVPANWDQYAIAKDEAEISWNFEPRGQTDW